jgi:hypothetical protein
MAQVGETLVHPIWGPGRIRVILDGGRRWQVVFDGAPQLPRTIVAAQFETRADRALPRIDFDAPNAALRQALEALRLGVVPAVGLQALTVGRDIELARLRSLIADARGMLLLSGNYGTGKTHLIEMVESEALCSRLVVARATFDPVEVPPSHPLRLYRALMQGLRYPDSPGQGLEPLLEKLVGRSTHDRPEGARFHRYLSATLWAMEKGDDALREDALAFVQGQLEQANDGLNRDLRGFGWKGPSMLALPDYRTFGQIMAYLLGGVAAWAQDAGYRGLLVLADEAEYLDQLETTSRDMATNVLKYLAMGSLDHATLPFDPGQVYRGGQSIHRGIPERFSDDQHLAVVCAFTPNPAISSVLRSIVPESSLVPLEPIVASELDSLADRIFALYREAWPKLDPPVMHRRIVTGRLSGGFRRGEVETTRQAARLVVEFWDIYRASPDRALSALVS